MKGFWIRQEGHSTRDFVSRRQPRRIGEEILSYISTMVAKGYTTASIGTRGITTHRLTRKWDH